MRVQRPTRFSFRGLQPTRGKSEQHTVECKVNVWTTALKSPHCQGNIRSQPGSLPKTRALCARFPSRFQIACRQNDRNVIECARRVRNWIAHYGPLFPSRDTALAKSLGVNTARSRLPGLPEHPRCACVFNTLPRYNRATFDTLHWVPPLSPSFANSGLSRWTRRLSMRNPQRFHIVLSAVLHDNRLLTFRKHAPPFVHSNWLSIE